jgi:thioredoxin reductase
MSSNGQSVQTPYQYLIIGAGPAGLQLAYCLERAGRSYLALESGDAPGDFFAKFPRHRRLISINKVYTGSDDPEFNLRMDWNSLLSDEDAMLFKHYSKRYFPHPDDLMRYLKDFADYFKLKVRLGAKVAKIERDDLFRLTSSKGETFSCQRLIVATGLSPYIPQIPGIELAEQYAEVSLDPDDFTNQRVLIIGKGNSAFETADNLLETTATIHLASPSPLKLAWTSHFVGHLRAVNNNVLETYLLKSQNGLLDATIDKIERREDGKYVAHFNYVRAIDTHCVYEYDRIIVCAGWRFDDSMFDDSCKPALAINNRFPDLTSEWESTNINNLYFAGTLMQMRDYKKTMSGFIHGFRFNVVALHRIFEEKYHGMAWPSRPIKATTRGLSDAIFERINRSASLWQQPGYFGDVIIVTADGDSAQYYDDMPLDYLRGSAYGQNEHYYTVTLEYGPDYPDYPFEFIRHTDAEHAHLNPQLHPVIRRYEGSTLIAEHHILEDLEANWRGEIFAAPLSAFLRKQLSLRAEMVI